MKVVNMPKPLGVNLTIGPYGPHMGVSRITTAEDRVWDAVEEAQIAGWTVKQFMREASEAWRECRERELKDEMKEFSKGR